MKVESHILIKFFTQQTNLLLLYIKFDVEYQKEMFNTKNTLNIIS